jgi:ABC-type dipeptide/oligopeptide/nickel transport system permease subunit
LAWVVLLAFFAVFAPLIASSHPIAYRPLAGSWSSPLVRQLGWSDVWLLFCTAVGLVLFTTAWWTGRGPAVDRPRWRLGWPLAFAIFGWLITWALPLTAWSVGWDAWERLVDEGRFLLPGLAVGLGLLLWVVVLVGLAVAVRAPWEWRVAVGVVALLWAVVMVVFPPSPTPVPLSEYREAVAAGDAQAVHTLIPYSPGDLLTDGFDPRRQAPGWHPTEAAVAEAIILRAESRLIPDERTFEYPTTIDDAMGRAMAMAQQAEARFAGQDSLEARAFQRRAERLDDELAALAATPLRTRLHLMGTTLDGRDMASRMMHACRIALSIGLIATGIAVVIGVLVGGLLGYFSGWVDLIGLRLVEVFSAIPVLFLLITLVAVWGRNLYLIMTIIGLTGWMGYAYFVRAEFFRIRKMDYVQAARATGTPLGSLLLRHMLPNGVTPVLVSASFGVAAAILTESVLSFLGLGLVDEPSWGQMLQQARQGLGGDFAWWIAVFPIGAIFLTVMAYNLIGESMRDAIDPQAAVPETVEAEDE